MRLFLLHVFDIKLSSLVMLSKAMLVGTIADRSSLPTYSRHDLICLTFYWRATPQ